MQTAFLHLQQLDTDGIVGVHGTYGNRFLNSARCLFPIVHSSTRSLQLLRLGFLKLRAQRRRRVISEGCTQTKTLCSVHTTQSRKDSMAWIPRHPSSTWLCIPVRVTFQWRVATVSLLFGCPVCPLSIQRSVQALIPKPYSSSSHGFRPPCVPRPDFPPVASRDSIPFRKKSKHAFAGSPPFETIYVYFRLVNLLMIGFLLFD